MNALSTASPDTLLHQPSPGLSPPLSPVSDSVCVPMVKGVKGFSSVYAEEEKEQEEPRIETEGTGLVEKPSPPSPLGLSSATEMGFTPVLQQRSGETQGETAGESLGEGAASGGSPAYDAMNLRSLFHACLEETDLGQALAESGEQHGIGIRADLPAAIPPAAPAVAANANQDMTIDFLE